MQYGKQMSYMHAGSKSVLNNTVANCLDWLIDIEVG